MGRSRSASVRKASVSWEGIHRFSSRELYVEPQKAKDVYEQHIGNHARLELEFGCGNGDFIVEAARLHPKIHFVGIEYAQKFMRLIRDRVVMAGLHNVTLICAEGRSFIKIAFPNESVDRIHVYFPDPWHKKSNRHKRSMSPEGMQEFHRILKPGGDLFFSTDHAEYAATVREDLQASDYFDLEDVEAVSPEGPRIFTAYETSTHFGKKHQAKGTTIHRFHLRRREVARTN